MLYKMYQTALNKHQGYMYIYMFVFVLKYNKLFAVTIKWKIKDTMMFTKAYLTKHCLVK